MLGLNRRVQATTIPGTNQPLPPALKFLQPKSQCEYEFGNILDDITKDPVYILYIIIIVACY